MVLDGNSMSLFFLLPSHELLVLLLSYRAAVEVLHGWPVLLDAAGQITQSLPEIFQKWLMVEVLALKVELV